MTSPKTYPQEVLADQPSVYYRLGEKSGSVAADSSPHGVDGTYGADATRGVAGAIAGDSNGAVAGSDAAVVTAPAASLPAGDSARTLEIWYRASDLSANSWPVISYGGGQGVGLRFDVGDGSAHLEIDGGTNPVIFSLPYDDGLWHLYDVTFTGAVVTGYADGQAIGSAALTLDTAVAGSTLAIGGGTGSFDEAAIYPSALTPARIDAHWTRGASAKATCAGVPSGPYPAAIRADGPLVYYRLGDGSRLMLDSSGHCANAARVSDSGASVPGAIAGDPNEGVTGDGIVVLASASSLPAGHSPRTVEIWYKASDISTNSWPIVSYGTGQVFGIRFDVGDGSAHLEVDSGPAAVTFNLPFDDELWHQYDVTYDGSVVTGYVDGQEIGSATLPVATTAAGAPLFAGGGTGSYDELAVYRGALSPARVEAHWLASGNAPPAGGPPGALELPPAGNLSESCSGEVVHACSADPVDDESGAFSETASDLTIPGRGLGLDWTRGYSSAAASQDGPLGFGWTGSYAAHLSVDQPTGDVTVIQEDGSQLVFTPSAGGFAAPPRVQATLTRNDDGSYTLLRLDGEKVLFSSAGQLESLADRNGIVTSLSYSAGVLSSATDSAGRSLRFTWTGTRITRVADSTGRAVSYGYSASGDLTSVTDVDGGVTRYGYDSSHRLTSVLDPAQVAAKSAHPLTNVYDSAGRIVSQTDQLGRKTAFAYSGDPASQAGGTTLVTDPSGHKTLDRYVHGLRASMTQGYQTLQATTTFFRYDPATLGLTSFSVSAPADPNDHSQQFSYDARGLPVTEIDGLGRKTTLTYNSFGEVLTLTAPNPSATGPKTITTKDVYDRTGNLLSTSTPLYTSASRFVLQTTRDIRGDAARPDLVTSSIDPMGQVTRFGYDAAGNQTSVTTPEGRKTTRTYNARGEVVSVVAPAGHAHGANPARFTTTYRYDAAGRLLATSVADGSRQLVTKRAYDADGRELSLTDPAGRTTSWVCDRAGEITETRFPGGTDQRTTYWPDGVVRTQIDSAGHVIRYSEDSLGRTVSRTDALGHTTRYTFDAIGDVLTTTNSSGQVTTSQYDNDGDEVRRTYSSSMHPVTETYNRAGLRVSMTDGTGTSTWTWNSLGLLTSQHQAGGTIRYRYDLDAHLTGLTYPSGRTVTRSYGADGELTGFLDPLGAKTSFTYNRDGMLAAIHAPDRLTTTYAYNDLDELTKITVAGSHGRVASISYTLNADDQVTSERSAGLRAARQTYSYDSLGRLRGADGVPLRYDAGENLTRTSAGAVQSFNADDEITKQVAKSGHSSYTYNAQGSRTLAKRSQPAATVRYQYDQEQELTSYSVAPSASSAGRSVSYSYDGDGLRQSMTVNNATARGQAVQGQKRTFTYDAAGGLPLILTDGVNSYVYGPGATPLEQINSKTKAVTYLTADILGSVRLLASHAGKVVGTANYGPAGTSFTTGSASTPFGYAGQYRDPVSGLLWMRSRYYDPATGQFITTDPAAPVTLAPYQYANDDPVNLSDPSGLASARTVSDLKSVQLYSGLVATGTTACDLTGVGASVCGPVGAIAGVLNVGSSAALYYICHNPADLLEAFTGAFFGSTELIADRVGTGAAEFLEAGPEHATEQALNDAVHDLATSKAFKSIDLSYSIATTPSSFGKRFDQGISKISKFF